MKPSSENNPKHANPVTYIAGMGFEPDEGRKKYLRDLRITVNVISTFLILGIVSSSLLETPFLYFTNVIGLKIEINFFTGLIVASRYATIFAKLLAQLSGILIALLLTFLVFHRRIMQRKPFRRMHNDVLYSLPISASAAFLGCSAALLASFALFELFGIRFDSPIGAISTLNVDSVPSVSFLIFSAILEEILFRGIILSALRKFGDGFAIIISSLMGAFYGCNLSNFIFMLILGIVLGYFTVYTNNTFYALLSRIAITVLIILVRLSFIHLEKTLAIVILCVGCLFIILLAVFAFMRLIQQDHNAFTLKNEDEVLPTGNKLSLASSSIVFLVLLFFSVMQMLLNIQIIGR